MSYSYSYCKLLINQQWRKQKLLCDKYYSYMTKYTFKKDCSEKCPVCQTKITANTTVVISNCFHYFCDKCIYDVYDNKNNCCVICNEFVTPNNSLIADGNGSLLIDNDIMTLMQLISNDETK